MSLNGNAGGFRSRSQKKDSKSNNGQPQRRQPRSEHSSDRGKQRRPKPQRSELREIFAGIDHPRAVSFDVVYRVEVDGTYANLALPAY